MAPRNDAPEIKALLQANVPRLVQALNLEGHRSGKYWMTRSRAHDAKIGGMHVTLSGGYAGAWVDHVSGDRGDIISLIAHVKGTEWKDTFSWAREFLGLGTMTPEQRQRASQDAQRKAVAASVLEAQNLAKNRKRAMAVFLESKNKHPFVDSIADVYLRSRGVDIRLLTRLPGCIGFLPLRHHLETKTSWPVMTAMFTDDAGEFAAMHVTYLAHDGAGKAPLPPMLDENGNVKLDSKGNPKQAPERKIWPSYEGAAIRLWRGATRRSIADANAWAEKHGELETLVLCEGVEDGLSSVLAYPEYRTWAVGALGNLANIKLPPCVDRVIVWKDNDWSKPQAADLFNKGIASLQRQGARVSIARSSIGKDANDALRGKGG